MTTLCTAERPRKGGMCIDNDSDTALETEGTHALIDTEITKEGQVP